MSTVDEPRSAGGGRQAALRAGLALVAGTAVGIGGQVLWTARRPLPSLEGLDATGRIAGTEIGPAVRLVALGDSTLTGPGLTDPDHIWLRRALLDLAPTPTIDLISLAVGGSRVADLAAVAATALELCPDAAVVAIGSNDAIHGTPVRAFGATLDRLLGELLDHVAAVAVCNVGDLGNLARVPLPLSSLLRQRSVAISRRIETVVSSHDGAILLDVTASNVGFRDRGVFAEDLFHPNEHGHALWAASARGGLAELLARTRASSTEG